MREKMVHDMQQDIIDLSVLKHLQDKGKGEDADGDFKPLKMMLDALHDVQDEIPDDIIDCIAKLQDVLCPHGAEDLANSLKVIGDVSLSPIYKGLSILPRSQQLLASAKAHLRQIEADGAAKLLLDRAKDSAQGLISSMGTDFSVQDLAAEEAGLGHGAGCAALLPANGFCGCCVSVCAWAFD